MLVDLKNGKNAFCVWLACVLASVIGLTQELVNLEILTCKLFSNTVYFYEKYKYNGIDVTFCE